MSAGMSIVRTLSASDTDRLIPPLTVPSRFDEKTC